MGSSPILPTMLYVGKNLGSKEAAEEYNSKVYALRQQWRGCISSQACPQCFHIITDSICLCAGLWDCPNCGYKRPKPEYEEIYKIIKDTPPLTQFAKECLALYQWVEYNFPANGSASLTLKSQFKLLDNSEILR